MWQITLITLLLTISAHETKKCDPQPWNLIFQALGLDKLEDTVLYAIDSSDIRQLCKGNIKTFPSLELIFINHANISFIEAGTFDDVSDIAVDLEDNKLSEVVVGVFNGTQISSVSLKSNEIRTIERGAFDDMPNLETVILGNNKISVWNNEWFKNTPKLTIVIFSSNLIETLPEDTLKNLHHTKNLTIAFDGNKIKSVNERSFIGVEEVEKINLATNELENFPPQVFPAKIKILDLKENKLQCLSEEQIRGFRGVFAVKLQKNPFTEVCKTNIVKYSNENGVKVYLSEDPFSYK